MVNPDLEPTIEPSQETIRLRLIEQTAKEYVDTFAKYPHRNRRKRNLLFDELKELVTNGESNDNETRN